MKKPGLSHLELAARVAAARIRWRHPLYLVHALTARCNARCGFCAWNPDFYDPKDQLSTVEIKRLYEDARRAGFVGLSIWGGEPLLHPDFGEVARHARALGFVTHMVTNGFLLEHKLDDVLGNLDRLCISLDHPSSQHDEMRGIRGLYDRIVAATRELRRRAPDMQVVFVYTMQRSNVEPEALRAMAALCSDLGVLGVFNALRQEAAADCEDDRVAEFAASPEQLARAFGTLSELKRAGAPILNSHTHLDMMRAGEPDYHCHWPKLMLPVEANGDVVDCMHWGTRPLGNVRSTPLQEILDGGRLAELAGPAGEACHKCVSIHRVEISEVWEGNLEPLLSWRMLQRSPLPLLDGPWGRSLAATVLGRPRSAERA